MSYIFCVIHKLADPYSEYYSRGYLNSEGMKVINVVARALLRRHPWLKSYLDKVRRRRDHESVLRLIEEVERALKVERITSLRR